MATLYELKAQYATLLAMAEDGDMDPEAVTDTLASLKDGIEDKAIGYAQVIKSLDSDVKTIEEEEKRLAARKQSLKNNQARMKEALTDALQTAGLKKVKSPLMTVWIQASTSVQVPDDYRMLPPQFVTKKVTHVVDKRSIKAALEAGTTVVGADLRTNWSPRIR